MDRKLTAKIQKINPKVPDTSSSISNCLVIEPDDDVMLEKKGVVYTAFEVSGKNLLDSLLVTKIVNDILHDSYFQSETASPIQAVEKAILKLRDNITQISKDAGSDDINLTFSIAAAVLWGNTLYLVQYGNTKIFLMREGKIKPVEAATEGNFSVASGVVKDSDVVILATNNFVNRFPPEKLISAVGLATDTLNPQEACLILKFDVIKEFSSAEVIDFGGETDDQESAATKNNKVDGLTKVATSDLPAAVIAQPAVPNTAVPDQPKTAKPTTTKPDPSTQTHLSAEKANTDTTSNTPAESINKQTSENKRKKPKWLLIMGIALLVVGIVAIGNMVFTGRADEDVNGTMDNGSAVTDVGNSDEPTDDTTIPVIDVAEDEKNKVVRVPQEVFYDVRITDSTAESSGIAVVGDKVFVNDTVGGKIYVSDVTTPKFTALQTTFTGVKNIFDYDGNLALVDAEGFKVLDPTTFEVIESYAGTDFGATATYLEFIYSVGGDELTKYTKDTAGVDGELSGELWTQNAELTGAKSLGIDVSIYVLNGAGKLLSFTTGTQDNFTLSGLDKPLNNPIQMLTTVDMQNIYVADKGNNRIVVLSKAEDTLGEVVTQYRLTDEAVWNDIRGFGVNAEETKGYVLNGNKVYEFELQE